MKELIEEAAKKELEKNALPIWAITKIANEIKGESTLDFDQYLERLKSELNLTEEKVNLRTPEEIEKDFLKIVENDKKAGESNG